MFPAAPLRFVNHCSAKSHQLIKGASSGSQGTLGKVAFYARRRKLPSQAHEWSRAPRTLHLGAFRTTSTSRRSSYWHPTTAWRSIGRFVLLSYARGSVASRDWIGLLITRQTLGHISYYRRVDVDQLLRTES